ncbi:MAG TPA: signal peptidase I [Chloroflexota bacterium]|nr:signal peptidase I [Chloroflexota bacterium]
MKAALRDIFETLLLTVVIFLIVQSIVKNFKVEGTSMEPTLHNNEFLLVDKAVFWSVNTAAAQRVVPSAAPSEGTNRVFVFHGPQRGNIIVFEYPRDTSRDFIKRVIGLPGDTVEIHDQHVYVNGRALAEPYIMAAPDYSMAAVTVPPGQYFVLGDNRNDSSDSHVWGTVPFDDIIGEALVSYWPLGDWQFFPSSVMAAP